MRAASADDYARAPVGRYVAGRTFVVWVDSPSFAGSAYAGRVDDGELADILRLTALPEHWTAETGYDVLVDCSALAPINGPAFALLVRQLHEITPVATKLRRAALVRPAGVAGAIIAGVFHDTIQAKFRSALFSDRAEAVRWLGRPDGAEALARIDDLLATVFGAPPPLRTLRDQLARDPAHATLATSARALGMSERSLSRRLSELGTSFRDEVQRARVRAAEALLVDTELKLDAVARTIGFASRAHFSDFFHRATGETASEFRARRR